MQSNWQEIAALEARATELRHQLRFIESEIRRLLQENLKGKRL